jgi:hypothetical protein
MELMNYPFLVLIISLVGLWLSAQIGDLLRQRVRPLDDEQHEDFNLIVGANLTLLALLIGFSFSMAISRYDQRKNLEEAEANAIGTAFLRADLLPDVDAAKLRTLLKTYTRLRILFYNTLDAKEVDKINADTARTHNEMWSTVRSATASHDTPIQALVVSGMNDVINSQGYTQAAWWNRIPIAAWALMAVLAVCCNIMIGYGLLRRDRRMLLILPVAVAVSFYLICDIESPHRGGIQINPQNLEALEQSFGK